ncbi:MAG TPA: acetyl-CoA carboxylase biotin carboxyl carrier protein [Terriglobia bacterium]|nr:acetyl-CoA carboxylase biotin carboxyl carrier protein [Terriglobia bacterium]
MPGKTPRKEERQELLNLEALREIVDLLSERGISEFEMEKNGFRIRIKRGTVLESSIEPGTSVHAERLATHPIVAPVTPLEAPAPAKAEVADRAPDNLHVIRSPIVGTFYGSPSPEAPPYVKVGDKIQKGQVLCIIEAMKLMNEIEAEISGEIAEIYVQSGQPVEYGQSLFGIIPSGS